MTSRSIHLRHQSAEANNICLKPSLMLLFVQHNGVKKTDQMLVIAVIDLPEVFEPLLETHTELRVVVVLQLAAVWSKLVLLIEREVSDFLAIFSWPVHSKLRWSA